MSGINWTDEQPTEPGWYWARLINSNWIDDKCETIAYVREHFWEDTEECQLVMYICGCEYGMNLDSATHFSKIVSD